MQLFEFFPDRVLKIILIYKKELPLEKIVDACDGCLLFSNLLQRYVFRNNIVCLFLTLHKPNYTLCIHL